MKFSIILPVYNVEKYLQKSIDSLIKCSLNQGEIEFLFIDDGSTDSSVDIIQKYSKVDKRIHLYRKNNEGAGYARNYGLDLSKGEYIYFMDPDDWIDPKIFSDISYKNNPDIILFGFDSYRDEKKINEKVNTKEDFINQEKLYENFNYLFEQNSFFVVWNKIYSKKFLYENQLRFTNQKTGQDALFNIQAFEVVKKLQVINKIFYHYRSSRTESAQNSKKNIKIYDNLNIFRNYHKFITSKNISFKLCNEFFINLVFKDREYIKNMDSRSFESIKKYLIQIKLTKDYSPKIVVKYLYIKLFLRINRV